MRERGVPCASRGVEAAGHRDGGRLEQQNDGGGHGPVSEGVPGRLEGHLPARHKPSSTRRARRKLSHAMRLLCSQHWASCKGPVLFVACQVPACAHMWSVITCGCLHAAAGQLLRIPEAAAPLDMRPGAAVAARGVRHLGVRACRWRPSWSSSCATLASASLPRTGSRSASSARWCPSPCSRARGEALGPPTCWAPQSSCMRPGTLSCMHETMPALVETIRLVVWRETVSRCSK